MMPPPPAMLKSDSPRNKEALFDRIMAWQETSAMNVSPDSDELILTLLIYRRHPSGAMISRDCSAK